MRVRRIIVGLDAAAPLNRAALEAAVALAERAEAELVGLFVENVELLHLAALPFAREVGYPSATSREFDVARMERALRALAFDAERLLGSVAGRGPVRWSFRVTRGVLAAELLAAAREADLLLICSAHGGVATGPPAVQIVSAASAAELRIALQGARGGMLVLAGEGDEAISAALREWSAMRGRSAAGRGGKAGA